MGFLVFVFLPDSPVKTVRFTEAEKIAALLRVKENQSGTQNARVKKAQVIEPLQDIRIWLVALSVILTSIPNGGLGTFSNILLTTFGYTSQQSVRGQRPCVRVITNVVNSLSSTYLVVSSVSLSYYPWAGLATNGTTEVLSCSSASSQPSWLQR
jgi:hypothetical protein